MKHRRRWVALILTVLVVAAGTLLARHFRQPRTFYLGADDSDKLRVITSSDDGRLVVAVQPHAGVSEVWDTATAQRRRHTTGSRLGDGHEFPTLLAIAPDQKQYAVAFSDGISLFDTATGSAVRQLRRSPRHTSHVYGYDELCYSADGSLLAAAFRIGDRVAGSTAATPSSQTQAPQTRAPQTRAPQTQAPQRSVQIWDVKTGRLLLKFEAGHNNSSDGIALAFSPAAGRDASVKLTVSAASDFMKRGSYEQYALPGARRLGVQLVPMGFDALRYHPGGALIIGSRRDLESDAGNVASGAGNVASGAGNVASDAGNVASGAGIDAFASVTGKMAYQLKPPIAGNNGLPVTAFSHDGKLLAVLWPYYEKYVDKKRGLPPLTLYNALTGQPLRMRPGNNRVKTLVFSADDGHLIATTDDGSVLDWSLR